MECDESNKENNLEFRGGIDDDLYVSHSILAGSSVPRVYAGAAKSTKVNPPNSCRNPSKVGLPHVG